MMKIKLRDKTVEIEGDIEESNIECLSRITTTFTGKRQEECKVLYVKDECPDCDSENTEIIWAWPPKPLPRYWWSNEYCCLDCGCVWHMTLRRTIDKRGKRSLRQRKQKLN
jgi:hypothetical protein